MENKLQILKKATAITELDKLDDQIITLYKKFKDLNYDNPATTPARKKLQELKLV